MNPDGSASPAVDLGRLRSRLGALVGESNVLSGTSDRAFFSQDIARAGTPAGCVAAPGTVEELASAGWRSLHHRKIVWTEGRDRDCLRQISLRSHSLTVDLHA